MITKTFLDRTKMINLLIVTSVLMISSLITIKPKIIGITMLLWVLCVFWNVYLMLRSSNLTFGSIANEIDNKYDDAKSKRHFGEQILYSATIPMMAIGLFMVVLIIVTFLVIM